MLSELDCEVHGRSDMLVVDDLMGNFVTELTIVHVMEYESTRSRLQQTELVKVVRNGWCDVL